GGTFTQVRNDNSQTVLTRNRMMAFDATTGQISTTFNPAPNGQIRIVLPTGDGTSVYVAGKFTSIGGVARTNIARVRISDGAVLSTFNVGAITGEIKDIALHDGRLWLAGAFTHVSGHHQPALATVDPTTGAFLPYMGRVLAGVHNGGVTQVLKISITPNGSRLVAIGNFDTVDAVKHHQIVMLDLTGATAAVASFNTTFYQSACSQSFDSYMRDVDFSPDGSFFVVSTTGAYGGSTSACDQTSRWETAGTGSTLQPSWTDYTGGDTTYGVEVTNSAVYVGGHFRWQNNAFAGDSAGPGAVSREGLAALDPVNGLPLTWDPTRTKGVGVFDFLNTPQGLWIASDTDRIGAFVYKGRIARMPQTGATFPALHTPTLPNDVFLGGNPSSISRRSFTGTSAGATTSVPTGGTDWTTVRGAFMLNGYLYVAHSNGTFTKRTFNGTTYGAEQAVNTADQIVPIADWNADMQTMTGMFYDNGRIYFTKSGSSTLFYRYFSPQSDVVGTQRLTASTNVSGIDFSQVQGMFGTPDRLYWATSDGNLHRINWAQNAQSGAPVAGTAAVVSGPGTDGNSWNSRALFLYQDANGNGVGQPPTAAFTSSCTSLHCSFDGSTSTAPGSTITSYAWTFSDGGTATGVTPTHNFPATGTYNATLTVTTSSGATNSITKPISVTQVNQAPVATFTTSCTGLTCSFDAGGSSDPDGTIASYAWNYGDSATGTGVTSSHTYASGGARTVTLTVTDNQGAPGTTTRSVNPSLAAVNFVAATNHNANATAQQVTIPASVQPGDTLVLNMSVNTTAATIPSPAGWTLLDSLSGNLVAGRSWTRTAVAGDAGSTVTVNLSSIAKADLSLAAYRGSGGSTTTVAAHSAALDQTSGTAHTSPAVTAAAGSWVATYWSAKASVGVTWATPASEVTRASGAGTGGGALTSRLVDSGGAVPAGANGGLVGTTNPAVTRVVMFSTVIGLQ
ncbi:MAG: domain containing protein, partial [Marmoricola sp.]|nr:domain containing protein [Marmoricola sp.]